jgi:endonuclease G
MKNFLLLSILFCNFVTVYSQCVPKTTNVEVIEHTYYSIGYSHHYKVPLWVQYTLTPKMASELASDVVRKDAFRPDPKTSLPQATDKDYSKSGFDRGHLCPAEDMDFNASSMLETFYYTNMSPQVPAFNRGIWKVLESKVRDWATKDTIIVITGSIVLKSDTTIGNKITVPSMFYKVVVSKDYKHGIGFVMKNKKDSNKLEMFSMSISSVEKFTGFEFFPCIKQTNYKQTISSHFKL